MRLPNLMPAVRIALKEVFPEEKELSNLMFCLALAREDAQCELRVIVEHIEKSTWSLHDQAAAAFYSRRVSISIITASQLLGSRELNEWLNKKFDVHLAGSTIRSLRKDFHIHLNKFQGLRRQIAAHIEPKFMEVILKSEKDHEGYISLDYQSLLDGCFPLVSEVALLGCLKDLRKRTPEKVNEEEDISLFLRVATDMQRSMIRLLTLIVYMWLEEHKCLHRGRECVVSRSGDVPSADNSLSYR